jgi:hypothetical protein
MKANISSCFMRVMNYTIIFLTLSLFSTTLLSLNAREMEMFFSTNVKANGLEIILNNLSDYSFELKYTLLNQSERVKSLGTSVVLQKILPIAMNILALPPHKSTEAIFLRSENYTDFMRFYINVYEPGYEPGRQPLDKIQSYKCDIWISKAGRVFGQTNPRIECIGYAEPWNFLF